MDITTIVTAAISALSGAGVGVFASRSKRDTDTLAVEVSKDEVVLVHYDKIVDQLQEELARLKQENEELRQRNLDLEKELLEMNKKLFELTKEMNDMKIWLAKNLEGKEYPGH